MRKTIAAAVWLSLAPLLAFAGGFDGSVPLTCAVLQVIECGPENDCLTGSADQVDLPQFVKIDFEKMVVSGTTIEGGRRAAKIANKANLDGRLILQGMQNGRGWSITISESGKMTLAASDQEAGFLVFGACIGN